MTPKSAVAIALLTTSFFAPHLAAGPMTKPLPPKPRAAAVVSTSHSIRGEVSWYCRAGMSPCHYKYPPGSMVGAACGRLRAAMGPHWRGKTVTVRRGGRSVRVTLVDWCGNRSRLVDLYWEPMHRLGGTGVLDVRVSW